MEGVLKVAAGDILAQQDNVSSLRVGENLPPAVVGISVLKASRQGEHHAQDHGFRHLLWLANHLALSFAFAESGFFHIITDIPRFRYCFRRLILALC